MLSGFSLLAVTALYAVRYTQPCTLYDVWVRRCFADMQTRYPYQSSTQTRNQTDNCIGAGCCCARVYLYRRYPESAPGNRWWWCSCSPRTLRLPVEVTSLRSEVDTWSVDSSQHTQQWPRQHSADRCKLSTVSSMRAPPASTCLGSVRPARALAVTCARYRCQEPHRRECAARRLRAVGWG